MEEPTRGSQAMHTWPTVCTRRLVAKPLLSQASSRKSFLSLLNGFLRLPFQKADTAIH